MSGTSRRARFTGPSQRSGPLTMGQSNMLLCMKTDKPAHINVSAATMVPWDSERSMEKPFDGRFTKAKR